MGVKGKTYEEVMGIEKAKELKIKQSIFRKGKSFRKNIIPLEIRICFCGCGKTFECKSRGKGSSQKYLIGHNHRGILKSFEHKKKISEAHKGKKRPDLSERNKNNRGKPSVIKGIPKSEETCKNMRLGAIRRIENRFGVAHPNFNLVACEFFKSFDEEHKTKGKYAIHGGGEYYIKELGYWVDYFNPDIKLIMEYDEKNHFDGNGNLKLRDIKRQKEIMVLYPDFKFTRIRYDMVKQ